MIIKAKYSNKDTLYTQFKESIRITLEMDSASKGEEIKLDLFEIGNVLPCSIVLLSNKINECRNKKRKISIIYPKNSLVSKYLVDLGFGMVWKGKQKKNRSPLTSFTKGEDLSKIINEIIDSMYKVIPRTFGDSVRYLLAEMITNIEDHSQFNYVSIMAQYYRKTNYLDICILDDGITIPTLFKKNRINFISDRDAIHKALNGVSTKEEGLRGYGLRTSKKLVLKGLKGELHIMSRGGFISIYAKRLKGERTPHLKKVLKGTLLYFRFRVPKKPLNIHLYTE